MRKEDGYLAGANQNCYAACASDNWTCITRSWWSPLSVNTLEFFSSKQVGVPGAGFDGIPSILDTNPETRLDPFGADSTADATPMDMGFPDTAPLLDRNTAGSRHDIALNVMSLVEFHVDGGPWSPAEPTDGAFDEASTGFTFTSAPLGTGAHIVGACTVHSFGSADTLLARDALVVTRSPAIVEGAAGSASIRLAVWPNPSSGEVRLRFRAAASERGRTAVYLFQGRRVAELANRESPVGSHEVRWDGRLASGSHASTGFCVVALQSARRAEFACAVLLR